MKDVAIRTLSAAEIREAATFVDLLNVGEAACMPVFPAGRGHIEQRLASMVEHDYVPNPLVLRLYEGEGRICGFLGVLPVSGADAEQYHFARSAQAGGSAQTDSPTSERSTHLLLLGPLLSVGDWSGHADILFRELLSQVRRTVSQKQTESPAVSADNHILEATFYPANRNMTSFAGRNAFSLRMDSAGILYCATRAIEL